MGKKGKKKSGDLVRIRDGRLALFIEYAENKHYSMVWVPDINKKLLFLTREIDKVETKGSRA